MKNSNFKPLTKAEETIMQALWQLEKAFVKEIIDELPKPKPHYNTVSTILKILVDKKFVSFESLGNSNRYFAIVAKEVYSKGSMKQFIGKYFEGSYANMLSFFVKEKDINIEELESILREIKKSSS